MHPELRALSTMLDRQDFGPIIRGDLTEDHLVTADGATVLNFITQYKHITDGAARFPTLGTVRERYGDSGIELPDPEPANADLNGLIHEVQLSKLRADLRTTSTLLDQLSRSDDPLAGLGPLISELRRQGEEIQRAKHISLKDGIPEVILDYISGTILSDGIPWPWRSLQEATKGLQMQEFVVIAGRPKSRKTFTALYVAAHAFLYANARVLFVSPEMPGRQVLLRFIAFMAVVRYSEFKNAALSDAETARLMEIAEQYGRVQREGDEDYSFRLVQDLNIPDGHLPPSFDIVQGTNKSVSWIQTQIEVFRPNIVIVDSFYRLKAEGGKARDADWKQVTAISRSLKDLAMEQKVCIVGTHQMNRDAEGKVASLGNLALADAVSQDADLILQVITGKLGGVDHSALQVLGGREVPFDGVLIRNLPCYDFSEVRKLEDKSVIQELIASTLSTEKKGGGEGAKRGKRKAHNPKTSAVMQRREALKKVALKADKQMAGKKRGDDS